MEGVPAMTITQYITHLQDIRAEHVELEVEKYSVCNARQLAPPPIIGYRKVLSKCEFKPCFWYSGLTEEQKGEKVVKL
jgi:hypothetical protein